MEDERSLTLDRRFRLALAAWSPLFSLAHDKATADPLADFSENADACREGTFPAASDPVSIFPHCFYICLFPHILASYKVK